MSTNPHPWSAFELGLVTIEFDTPFLVGASENDRLFDSVFVTDANGLPSIPGASLAGVLRHALAQGGDPHTDERCCQVFGHQDSGDGQASHVKISFAHVHGQDDRPVAFRQSRREDPVLAFLTAGVGRDHVRIGMHGAADQRGKFDELVVPAGARFTFELSVSHASPLPFADLVALLARADLRIGKGTRRGLGRFRIVRAHCASFDLVKPTDLVRLGRVPVAIHEAVGSPELSPMTLPKSSVSGNWVRGTLTLEPVGTWMVGGGLPTGREPERKDGKEWDRLPVSERVIRWASDGKKARGTVTDLGQSPFVLPGSSVKGAVRHRTAFHARKAAGEWLEDGVPWPDCPTEAEKALFGEVRDGDAGRPGRVHISDIYLSPDQVPYAPLNHVSLDRFTQGPMDHLLFDEVALGQCKLQLDVDVRLGEDLPRAHRAALNAALRDLCEGRLALGAGRGHGRFRGELVWSDEAAWLKEGP